MDPGAVDAPGGSGDPPSPSPSSAAAATAVASAAAKEEEEPVKKSNQDASEPPAAAAAAAAATSSSSSHQQQQQPQPPSRYESQKRRDWNTFLQHLKNQKPPLTLPRCGGAHVIDFLKYLDQFGKTKVHAADCAYFGHPTPPNPCACPLRQAWGSLDALIGRLRAAYEENGGRPESNPFGVKAVRVYLREVRESQAKARGIPYEKKKRKRQSSTATPTTKVEEEGSSSAAAAAAAVVTTTAAAAAAADSSTASGAADSNTKGAEEGSNAPLPGGDTKSTTTTAS